MKTRTEIIEAYRRRIWEAPTHVEKEALLREMLELVDPLPDDQMDGDEAFVSDERQELMNRLAPFDEAVEKVQAILAQIEARRVVKV